ncbi:MAG: hypothetical protein COA84_05350 [Robiginitomaculum sp.]|nr:MAG: hypothetical protein COA84_05350 [Robiginitomaculum sp.]
MQKIAHAAHHANLAALLSHVFCCGLPALMNIVALSAGAGAFTATAPWVGGIHIFMHQFELPLLVFSGAALIVGIVAQWISARRDCGTQACDHGSCAPKKQSSRWVLMVAAALFLGNLTFYVVHSVLA